MGKERKSLGRRRSRSLMGFASKDICETISKSLEPPEKLLLLIERCFQHSLTVVKKDFMLEENFDGANCWDKVKPQIEDLCTAAVTENTISNQSCIRMPTDCPEKAELEAEQNKWTEKVTQYREELKKEISPSVISANRIEKEMPYDYSSIVKCTSSAQEKLHKQIGLLAVQSSTQVATMTLDHKNQKSRNECREYFALKTRKPREIIRKLHAADEVNNIKSIYGSKKT